MIWGGEFGRTPNTEGKDGRDHNTTAFSMWLAGGGTKPGVVAGTSDKSGAYPADNPQKPENLAATIYHALGIPATAMWKDELERPHHIYLGEPIRGLT